MPIFSLTDSPVSQPTPAVPGVANPTGANPPRLEPIEKPSNVKVIRKIGNSFTPSIKDALAGNTPEKQSQEVEQKTIFSQLQEIRSEPFSQEQFEAKWSEYIEQLTDRPNLKSTLSVIPEITDGNKLLLRIGNSVQEEEVRIAKPELMTWLRNELQNDSIELNTRLERVETERVIFSDSEKMQMMIQKNPNLFELKQKFNLDFKD